MMRGWTIATLIEGMAARGDQACLVDFGPGKAVLSCGEVSRAALVLARRLRTWGVGDRDAVALVGPSGSTWALARLGLGRAGAVVVAIDDLTADADVAAILRDAGCRRVLTTAGRARGLLAVDRTLAVIALDDAVAPAIAAPLDPAGDASLAPIDPAAPAMLTYTSGTTGSPKSFFLSHAHIAANVEALVAAGLVGPQDRVLLPLPLHHVYPLVVGLFVPLQAGAAVVFPETVGGPQIADALREARVTAVVGVPRLYGALIAAVEARLSARGAVLRAVADAALGTSGWLARGAGIPLGRHLFGALRGRLGPGLRLLVSGGARLDDDTLWRLVGLGFDVRCGYGLSETASSFTANLPGRERLGSEGRPFQGGEVRIAGADPSGEGEIELRGPCVFSGYRGNAEATRAAFTPDGWFRTGDLGRLDADGFLYVTGRVKEAIVLGGGKKVHPEDVERKYAESPFIREIAVLEQGGRLVALVVPDLDAIARTGNTQIADVVRVALGSAGAALPSYRQLAGFALTRQPLPRTRLGKYRRFLLPALYERANKGLSPAEHTAAQPEDDTVLASEAARTAFDILKARYPGKPVSLDANPLLDLGIDSLEWVALGLILEERLGVRLPPAAASEATSVRALLRLVADAASRPPAPRSAGVAPPPAPMAPESGLARAAARSVALGIFGLDWLAMRTMFPVAVEGRENLPAEGPFILVANHASYLDAPALAVAVGFPHLRRLHWAGAAGLLFGPSALHPLWRALQVFPVDEGDPTEGLATARDLLERGRGVVWFPEGWRSPDGALQRFQPGIGVLVASCDVPVVPAFIAGTFEALPRTRRLPRPHRIRVVIGHPISPETVRGEGQERSPQAIAERLREAVAALARERLWSRPHRAQSGDR